MTTNAHLRAPPRDGLSITDNTAIGAATNAYTASHRRVAADPGCPDPNSPALIGDAQTTLGATSRPEATIDHFNVPRASPALSRTPAAARRT